MKSCLKCGSTDLLYGIYRDNYFWKCKECGHTSPLIVDFPDESLKKMKSIEKAEKLGRKMSGMERKMRGRMERLK